MFEKIKAAGLTPRDLAKLLGLSRVTVSLWFNGHASPHSIHAGKVQNMLDLLGAAVDAGTLPIPGTIGRAERSDYLRTVVDQQLRDALTRKAGGF